MKIGDRIVITKSCSSCYLEGAEGIVKSISKTDCLVDFDTGEYLDTGTRKEWYVKLHELKLKENNMKPIKFYVRSYKHQELINTLLNGTDYPRLTGGNTSAIGERYLGRNSDPARNHQKVDFDWLLETPRYEISVNGMNFKVSNDTINTIEAELEAEIDAKEIKPNLIVKVRNNKHSAAVQRCLFNLGYKWVSGQEVLTMDNLDCTYFITVIDGILGYGLTLESFRKKLLSHTHVDLDFLNVEEKIKELTMDDIEEKYGCRVRIVKL